MRTRGKVGFTLIELLVVIAIIAILAAILFPVFAKAREKARQASCQANMKQMGLGCMMYAQDYDGKFPRNWTGNCWTDGNQYDWMEVTQPYTKNWQVYVCPSMDMQMATCSIALGRSHDGRWGGYAINSGRYDPAFNPQAGDGPAGNSTWRESPKDAQFQRSAETVLIVETNPACRMICGVGHMGSDSGSAIGWDARRTTHNDGMNVTYCDGHVKWHKRTFQVAEFRID